MAVCSIPGTEDCNNVRFGVAISGPRSLANPCQLAYSGPCGEPQERRSVELAVFDRLTARMLLPKVRRADEF